MPAHDQIETAGSDAGPLKSWLVERSTAVAFIALAGIAMVGWLYLLAQGLWAVASWLIF